MPVRGERRPSLGCRDRPACDDGVGGSPAGHAPTLLRTGAARLSAPDASRGTDEPPGARRIAGRTIRPLVGTRGHKFAVNRVTQLPVNTRSKSRGTRDWFGVGKR